jgi:hypothetical protein
MPRLGRSRCAGWRTVAGSFDQRVADVGKAAEEQCLRLRFVHAAAIRQPTVAMVTRGVSEGVLPNGRFCRRGMRYLRAGFLRPAAGYPTDVSTRGDKFFGTLAIVLGIAMLVAAVIGLFVTPWVVIGASVLVIVWLAVVRRRPPEKKVYRVKL